jgi:glycerone phosphate O-acyltransferase/fatty acyl-CoA reductase
VRQDPKLDPMVNEKDRLAVTNSLGNELIYSLQRNIRMMPTNLVASVVLLQRKGINENDLEEKVRWLGQTLAQRNICLSTYGLPSVNTLKIGVQHLGDYLQKKRDIYMPLVTDKDNSNYMMLGYYRNPLN